MIYVTQMSFAELYKTDIVKLPVEITPCEPICQSGYRICIGNTQLGPVSKCKFQLSSSSKYQYVHTCPKSYFNIQCKKKHLAYCNAKWTYKLIVLTYVRIQVYKTSRYTCVHNLQSNVQLYISTTVIGSNPIKGSNYFIEQKSYPECIVLVISTNGFEDIIEDWCKGQISPLSKYRQISNHNYHRVLAPIVVGIFPYVYIQHLCLSLLNPQLQSLIHTPCTF